MNCTTSWPSKLVSRSREAQDPCEWVVGCCAAPTSQAKGGRQAAETLCCHLEDILNLSLPLPASSLRHIFLSLAFEQNKFGSHITFKVPSSPSTCTGLSTDVLPPPHAPYLIFWGSTLYWKVPGPEPQSQGPQTWKASPHQIVGQPRWRVLCRWQGSV